MWALIAATLALALRGACWGEGEADRSQRRYQWRWNYGKWRGIARADAGE
ncbi:hypothetical protein JOE11_004417 [Robbsia andropogonis]|nr:hypothetical protein [Robbsia andropogonis]MCP1130314.1 hypothetical protein [Robbsia andropogonis]